MQNDPKTIIAPTAAYMSVAEAAVYSGLAAATLRKMIRRRLITGYRPVPGRVLICRAELDDLITRSAHCPRTRGANLHPPVVRGGAVAPAAQAVAV